MGKSLKDFNIEQYSSSDPKNIKWTQKNNVDVKKPKNKKTSTKNTTHSNIVHPNNKEKTKLPVENFFKVTASATHSKPKNKKKTVDKKFQKASASNCNIEQGFKRPGR